MIEIQLGCWRGVKASTGLTLPVVTGEPERGVAMTDETYQQAWNRVIKGKPGDRIVYDEQAYECVGFEPYIRKDGEQIELLVWTSECVTCGAPFRMRIARSILKPGFTRRCPEHKSGVRVKTERNRQQREQEELFGT